MSGDPTRQEEDHTLTVFCAYANVDTPFQRTLAEHLVHVGLQGFTLEWHPRHVTHEMNWATAFDPCINTASVICVLLSPDLLLSRAAPDARVCDIG